MSQEAGTLERFLLVVGEALERLAEELRPAALLDYLDQFGIRVPEGFMADALVSGPLNAAETAAKKIAPVVGPLRDAIQLAESPVTAAATTVAGTAVAAEIVATLTALRGLATGLAQAAAGVADPDVRAAVQAFSAELPQRFLERLLLDRMAELSREAGPLLAITGLADDVIDFGDPEDPIRPPYRRRRLYLDRVAKLVDDPALYLHDAFGWGAPDFDGAALFDRIRRWARVRGASADAIGELDIEPAIPPALDLGWFRLQADVSQTPPGLAAIASYAVSGDVEYEVPLGSGGWVGYVTSKSRFDAGLRAVLWPDGRLQVSAIGGPTISARMGLRLEQPDGEPTVLLGLSGGTRLEARKIDMSFSVEGLDVKPLLKIECEQLNFVLDLDGGDSFLKSVSGGERGRSDLSVGVTWSPTTGLRSSSSAAFEIAIPAHARIGPATIETIYVISDFKGSAIALELSAAVHSDLGPFKALVDRIGVEFRASFPDNGGNLGLMQLDTRFKPPKGVGLAINAPGVVGGGFLRFELDKHEYSGMLQLEIAEKISVKAIGLLSTRLPDGSKGYSLVLIIFVERFTPIQLGFGFALTGIGGLLALNRTFNEEALRAGLKNHTLDSVMFPQDPIRNAPQIISNLNRVFPPAAGHHLFGPMVQISWGTPALITAEIGVVLELGARLRVLILAQIAAILPRREHDLVRLQMDAIGIIDFDQGTASLDASLYDSRLLKKFVLTGDMALRLKWEGSPHFALSAGGLHPAFQPPPNFPKLERIAINLSSGDNPRLRCEAYYAITSNTVQWGARAELYATAAGFSIHGEIGYDVLIQFDPFFFIAEFHAQLQLKRGSTNLFKVKVEGSLAGPRPLHLKGKATFEILWWDVTIRVNATLIKGEKPPGPAPIDVLPRLKEALRHPDNWIMQMPAGPRPPVTLNARSEAADILLHPLGTLLVKENVVPLNTDISRFGQATPAGERRFTITDVTVGEDQLEGRPVRDFFAPAQFLELTDDEKLSRPSFEPMDAGVAFLSDAIVFTADTRDWLEAEAIEFETWILDKGSNVAESDDDEDEQGRARFYRLSPLLLSRQSRFGAAGSSERRRTGTARYHTGTAKHQMAREGWTIVDREHLSEQPVAGVADRTPTYSEAVAELRKLKREAPSQAGRFRILRPSELQTV